MTIADWLMIAAVLLGPIVAVQLTRYLDNKKEEQLTYDWVDHEDPSWAPDGRHIVCSQTSNFHSDLYILDTLGDPPLRLTTIQGEWYSPDWSSK